MCNCAGKGSLHEASCNVVVFKQGLMQEVVNTPNARLTRYCSDPRLEYRTFKKLLGKKWIACMEFEGNFTVLLDNGSEITFQKAHNPPSAA